MVQAWSDAGGPNHRHRQPVIFIKWKSSFLSSLSSTSDHTAVLFCYFIQSAQKVMGLVISAEASHHFYLLCFSKGPMPWGCLPAPRKDTSLPC